MDAQQATFDQYLNRFSQKFLKWYIFCAGFLIKFDDFSQLGRRFDVNFSYRFDYSNQITSQNLGKIVTFKFFRVANLVNLHIYSIFGNLISYLLNYILRLNVLYGCIKYHRYHSCWHFNVAFQLIQTHLANQLFSWSKSKVIFAWEFSVDAQKIQRFSFW